MELTWMLGLFLCPLVALVSGQAYDGCMIRYGRRGCQHRILTGVLVTCDGRRKENIVPQNLPQDTVYLSLVNFRFDRLQRVNFTRFPTVECMTILDSGISTVDPDTFSSMDTLHELVLENTQITNGHLSFMAHPQFRYEVVSVANSPQLGVVNVTATKTLRHIRTLNLHGNGLLEVGGQMFTELRNLEQLDLGDNRLTRLSWPLLSEMTKLNQLFLNGNRFQTIPESVFGVFFAVKQLSLGDNPFHCNCKLRWLRDFYDIAVDKALDFESVTCASPKARLMTEVPAEEFMCSRPSDPVIAWRKLDEDRYELNCSSTSDPAPTLSLTLPDRKLIISPPSKDLSGLKTATPQILTRPGLVRCEAVNSQGVSATETALPELRTGSASLAVASHLTVTLMTWVAWMEIR